jgi:hypothetical protein
VVSSPHYFAVRITPPLDGGGLCRLSSLLVSRSWVGVQVVAHSTHPLPTSPSRSSSAKALYPSPIKGEEMKGDLLQPQHA